jgi:nucleotide-binding universal stress UspA family protein
MIQISSLLCPIDFSEFSRDALDHAVALAGWYRADLTVMHVVAVPLVPVGGFAVEVPAAPGPVDTDEIADEVRHFVGPAIEGTDITPATVVITGNPAVAIAKHAVQMAADMLVLGTHGRSGFDRLVLGSVTERLLRTVSVPILTVPPPVKKPESVRYRHIVCPVDFSDESMRALEYALSLAQETAARLVLLHVLEGFLDEPDAGELRELKVFEYYEQLEQRAAQRLAAAVPDEARVWAHPDERVVKGKAYRQILRLAAEEGADLIVMGVRGRGALNQLLFGSTTHHVIREASCPVLTIFRP